MSDKRKSMFPAPARPSSSAASVKTKPRPSMNQSMVSRTRVPSTVNKDRVPSTVTKDRNIPIRPKINSNTTCLGIADATVNGDDLFLPEFVEEHRQIAYGRFLRAMLEDCLVSEKIQREKSDMDVQMAQLAMRFQQTVDQLDKTNRRVKEITFVAEQKRLLDLKSKDMSQFSQIIDKTNSMDILKDLTEKEQASLDRLETKNVDFGYDKNNGHQQLLDAVNDALSGLEEIKKHSHLDTSKFQEFDAMQKNLEDVEKEKMDLESLRKDFETKFPNFSEKLLKETSEKIAKMIEDSDED